MDNLALEIFARPQTHMKNINQNFLNMRNIHYVREIESWVGLKVLKVKAV